MRSAAQASPVPRAYESCAWRESQLGPRIVASGKQNARHPPILIQGNPLSTWRRQPRPAEPSIPVFSDLRECRLSRTLGIAAGGAEIAAFLMDEAGQIGRAHV